MRQVPRYLIIGNGRLARHFQQYFLLQQIHFQHWHRALPLSHLYEMLMDTTHVLVLISDQAIEPFIKTFLPLANPLMIHCSGSLVTPYAYGAHPLMSFSSEMYPLSDYQSIPFMLDENAPAFSNLFPGLPNPHFSLTTALKKKYHALCVLGGNFSCLLWQKVFSTFEKEFKLPASVCFPYLQQQTHNLITHWQTALTGPLTRNDLGTIDDNIQALLGDSFQAIYKQFVVCYQTMQEETL